MEQVITKQGIWDEGCIRCPLHKCRSGSPPIFGSGNEFANYLLITDAPTLEDAATKWLYAGDFGDLLDELLEICGIDPRDTFRTTLVSCPSYVVIPKTEQEEERISYQKPAAECVKACHPRLAEVIYTIDPALIITFGDDAWKSLVPLKGRHFKNRAQEVQGELFDVWIEGRERKIRYPVAPMLSLNTVFGNPSTAPHAPRSTTIKYLSRAVTHTTTMLQGSTL